MANTLDLSFTGLYKLPNQFSRAPKGAVLTADNVVVDKEGTLSCRRGFERYSTGTQPAKWLALTEYKQTIVGQGDTNLYYDTGNGVFSLLANNIYRPSTDPGSRVRFAEENRNLYITTNTGVKKLADFTQGILESGAPKGLGGSGVTSGGSGWFTNNTNVAYRIVWGYRDLNNNLILGAPSDRIIVSNTSGGTRNVDLTFTIPNGIATNYFYQVYRSLESATLADPPNDNLQLCYEANPTSGQLTAGLPLESRLFEQNQRRLHETTPLLPFGYRQCKRLS